MLNFKNTLIAFSMLFLIVLALDYLQQVNWWWYAGIILVCLLIMAWGSKTIQLNFYLKSLNHGDRKMNSIALTFDDGPDGQVTPVILDVLKENNVKATFFIVGHKAELHADIIKRIDQEGHIIGGHSFSHHYFFDLFSSINMQEEMRSTQDVVFRITGKQMSLFRPPYGVTNPPIAKAIKAMKYQSIGWSLKSKDTVMKDESRILRRILKMIKNGDILLFHDSKSLTMKFLPTLIRNLQEREVSISRLDKLLNIQAYVH
jgi:peptidoglycan/xylan/chitin deacetylase (PgdA/CDA1 family)